MYRMKLSNMNKTKLILLSFLLLSTTQLSANPEAIKLFNDGQIPAAKLLFEQDLKETTTAPETLAYLARIALRQDDMDSAEDLAKEAVVQAPKNSFVQYSYGIVMGRIAQDASIFSALGYAKKTLSGFNQAVVLEPDNIAYRQSLMSYHLAAPGIAGGDKDIALQQAEKIKTLDLKIGTRALINVYAVSEDKTAIKALFTKLPAELSQDADILFHRGLYQLAVEAYPAAVQDFKLAIQQAGDKDEFQQSKFGAMYQIGRTSVISKTEFQQGIESLQEYIKTAPKLSGLPPKDWAEFRMANLIEADGRKDEAVVIYKRLAKNVSDKRLKKAIKAAL